MEQIYLYFIIAFFAFGAAVTTAMVIEKKRNDKQERQNS